MRWREPAESLGIDVMNPAEAQTFEKMAAEKA